MQRWCNKLRLLAVLHSTQKTTHNLSVSRPSHRLLHSSSQILHKNPFDFKPPFTGQLSSQPLLLNQASYCSHLLPLLFIQVRHLTKKEYKEKMKKYKPRTPITSKLKKVKIKCYSSFKGRFRVMNDGKIRRWKEGKRHNAHLKSKKAKRRLRQPGIVPLAYAKVMKKLNFCG